MPAGRFPSAIALIFSSAKPACAAARRWGSHSNCAPHCRPLSRREQVSELFQLVRNRHVEANALAHFVEQLPRFGAAERNIEASRRATAGEGGMGEFFLLWRHFQLRP